MTAHGKTPLCLAFSLLPLSLSSFLNGPTLQMEIGRPKLSERLFKGQMLFEKQMQRNGPESPELPPAVLELLGFASPRPDTPGHLLPSGSGGFPGAREE